MQRSAYSQETPTQVFSGEIWETFKDIFFCRFPPLAASATSDKSYILFYLTNEGCCSFYLQSS